MIDNKKVLSKCTVNDGLTFVETYILSPGKGTTIDIRSKDKTMGKYFVVLNCRDKDLVKLLTDDDDITVMFKYFRQAYKAGESTELGKQHGFMVYGKPSRRLNK